MTQYPPIRTFMSGAEKTDSRMLKKFVQQGRSE